MSTPLGSEPAFPHAFQRAGDINYPAVYVGMSTRTWLAGTIAAGMWANETWRSCAFAIGKDRGISGPRIMGDIAKDAADDLLIALAAPIPANPPQGIPPVPGTP